VIHYQDWKILRRVCLLEVVTNQYQHEVDVCRAQVLGSVTAQCVADLLQCRLADPKAPHHITSVKLSAGHYKPGVSHCVGLRVYDPGSIPSSLTHRLVRTGPSAHNVSRRRYRSQFP
jgi:hypothetical protein